jgi:hypothetical protein
MPHSPTRRTLSPRPTACHSERRLAADGKQSFWSTAPGIVTAVAGLVSAVGVLIGSLAAAGVIGGGDGSGSSSRAGGTTRTAATSATGLDSDRITQYVGTWTNDAAAPDTVVRIGIAGSGPLLNVHAFAACQPVDCDWGTRSPPFADPLVALFDLATGRTEKLTMLLSPDATRLEVTEQSSVTGSHDYSFHR